MADLGSIGELHKQFYTVNAETNPAIEVLTLQGHEDLTIDAVPDNVVIGDLLDGAATPHNIIVNYDLTGDPVTGDYHISGTVLEEDVVSPLERTVVAHRRDTGKVIGTTISDPTTGAFTINIASFSGECYVIALDDHSDINYNALIVDKLWPKPVI